MNWQSDPELKAAMAERQARTALWRNTLTWGPLFLVVFAGFVYFFVDEARGGDTGSWFLVILLGFFASLLAVQAFGTTMDLGAHPVEMTGTVTRRWSRTDSLVIRSHYVRVEGKIFRIDRDRHGDLSEGDHVRIRFYPRSAMVVTVQRLEPPPVEAEASGADGAR